MDNLARQSVRPARGQKNRRWHGFVVAFFLFVPVGCQSVGLWQALNNSPRPISTSPEQGEALRSEIPHADSDVVPVMFAVPPEKANKKKAEETAISSSPVVPAPVINCEIDLPTALGLAGVENPTIALAQEAVRASLAEQLQADAMLLPSLQAGASINVHRGNLLSAQGIIRDVNRQSLYAGAGASAIGGGTVGFPGVRITAHLADAIFEPAAARVQVTGRQLDAQATYNSILLDVTSRFFDLLGAEARLASIQTSEQDLAEIVRLTSNFAKAGQGREGDAERARTEALLLHSTEQRLEEAVAVAAAEFAALLHIDTAVRLYPVGTRLFPVTLIDPKIDLEQLIRIAVDTRPEVAARTADVVLAETRLRQERLRPFVPFISMGLSAGEFGGGSNLTDTRFGHFSGRTDYDALAVWTLQNFGFGNCALQRRRQVQIQEALALRVLAVDQVRREVAEAHALCSARKQEIDVMRRRVELAAQAYQEDLKRARNLEGRPIELLNSADLLVAARQDLIRTLIEFNQAQFHLFVALGKPPTLACPLGGNTPVLTPIPSSSAPG